MMLWSTVLPLLVLLATVHECRGAHHYYVTATNGSDCPLPFPCHPLNYYVQNAASYFTSNTVVEFLPGLHELNYTGHVFITFVRNLTLIGSESNVKPSTRCSHSDSIVFCTDYSGFYFGRMNDLKLMNLQFTHCGAVMYSKFAPKLSFDSKFYYALGIIGVQNLLISGVTIEKSYGFGFYGFNIWNRSVITDSCFISNNEYVGKYQRCIDPEHPASCTGGNFHLGYLDFPLPGIPATSSLEINNSEFLRGVSTIQPEPQLALAGGLEIVVRILFGHDIHITINNTVVAENSGYLGGNIYIGIGFGVERVAVRLDRCYIHSGKIASTWLQTISVSTGLTCTVTVVDEHLKGDTMPVHISKTKFISNYGGALSFVVGARSSFACNSSTYQILLEGCEVSANVAHFGRTGLMAGMLSDERRSRVSVQESVLKLRLVIQNSTFHHNYKLQAFSQEDVDLIQFYQLPEVEIINSTFYSNTGSRTITVFRSKIIFQGQVEFENNTSTTDGGALHLDDSSLLHFKSNTSISFTNNRASQRGGAIYVDTTKREDSLPFCFFEVLKGSQKNIQLVFKNNLAEIAGDAVYGGQVDRCRLFPKGPYWVDAIGFGKKNIHKLIQDPNEVFESLFKFTNKTHSHSVISSEPFRICFCSNESEPNFGVEQSIQKEAYPGQMFYVEAVAVGQYNGTTPGVVLARAVTSNTTSVLREVHLAQESKRSCTRLQYSISSISEYEVIQLVPAGVSRHFFFADINVTMLACPPGFALQNATSKCDCHPLLSQYNVTCNIDNQTITKGDSAWISLDKSLASEVLLHPECPFDYCKVGAVTFKLTENPDFQCAFSHTGVLCGACLPGLSLALGTSRCLDCSNVWLLLLLPFAAAGLALVFLLLTLNLTVSTGTVNGLIFYANIVRANHAVFFPPGDRSFFSLFIAWLNLDLGVETCFWDGLDGYAKTWLQFVFPVYIWVIVGIIIWLSRRYVLVAKLCGSHTVKVLATLFLLSYAKVLRTIITALSFTSPRLLDGSTITVWLYDGNVDYLGVKHAFLFFTALVFAVGFVLPFTLLVLLAPCLQAWSNKRFFRWVHRIKPLLDAYLGPYRDKFRCWTGVMLVVRNVLFLSFAANGLGDPDVNLALINTIVLGLQGFMWLSGRVYKVLILDILETIFTVKLGIFSAWTIFIRHNNSDPVKGQLIAAYTITAITIIIFVAIVCYHIWIAITRSRTVKKITRKPQAQQEGAQQEGAQQESVPQENPINGSGNAAYPSHAPTVTYINMNQLRESLLSYN